MCRQSDDRGFSLIELLIVIVILGMLSAVVVLAVRGISEDGEDNACEAGARTLAVAVESYFATQTADTIPPTPADSVDDERFERTIVEAGLTRRVSEFWDVDEVGRLVSVQPCD